MLYYANLKSKGSNSIVAYGVAKKDNRGLYKFNYIPTMNRKPFINITKRSTLYVELLDQVI
ncbi:hypothetical protein [Aquibacillus saliphilus]|uniref:hypothetical protein n=1 Tax=Aquibacillus saliphilus TaxID=1909422 RepID=UPI001CF09B72|nr:hypothetical protein [Aquibacillus saliphilus]